MLNLLICFAQRPLWRSKPPRLSHAEVIIDLEPILEEIGDFSPTGEVFTTAREALSARFECIRAECAQPMVG